MTRVTLYAFIFIIPLLFFSLYKMQNKVTKSAKYQEQKQQPENLRDLLRLTAAETILLDACARKSAQEGMFIIENYGKERKGKEKKKANKPNNFYSSRDIRSFTPIKPRYHQG
jgi:hypothetical protein